MRSKGVCKNLGDTRVTLPGTTRRGALHSARVSDEADDNQMEAESLVTFA
jgi:hypothetical protein